MRGDVREHGRGPFRWRLPNQKGEADAAQDPSVPASCTVYIAGLCAPMRAAGGWSYLAMVDGQQHEASGEEWGTSQQRLELIAAVQGLAATPPQSSVALYTSAQAVVHGITKRLDAWIHNDWHTAAGQPIEDRDLWMQLQALTAERQVDWQWLKGTPEKPHASYSHRVHLLADAARRQALGRTPGPSGDPRSPHKDQPRSVEDTDPALTFATIEKGAQLATGDAGLAAPKGVQLDEMATATPATETSVRTASAAPAAVSAAETGRRIETTPASPFVGSKHGGHPGGDTAGPADPGETSATHAQALEITAKPAREAPVEPTRSAEEDRPMSSSDAPPAPAMGMETPGHAETTPSSMPQVGAQGVQGVTAAGRAPAEDSRRAALLAECQSLEQRWAELATQLVRLNAEWQRLVEPLASADGEVEGTEQSRRLLGWADGALLFYELDRYGERLSTLAAEALQTCNQYAAALQRVAGSVES